MTDEEARIIDEIQLVRARNNVAWMNLVRLALHVAPEDARLVFDEIRKNDEILLGLSTKLGSQKG